MEFALQVPELLERYDELDTASTTVSSDVAELLSDCERLEDKYRRWHNSLKHTVHASGTEFFTMRNVEDFSTYASLVADRTLHTAYAFTDQKFAFLHQQYWCCDYYLRQTIFHLREYQRRCSSPGVQTEQ